MSPRFIKKYLPTPESVRANRYFAWTGEVLHHPRLWHLTRKAVAGGVAVGMFAGLVPGPLQMLTAALLAIALRVNLPVSLATTLYTNPFTIGPLYLIAYQYGLLFVGGEPLSFMAIPSFSLSEIGASVRDTVDWLISLGKPLAVGLVALGLTLAGAGYIAVHLAWRAWVVHAWRKRKAQRARR